MVEQDRNSPVRRHEIPDVFISLEYLENQLLFDKETSDLIFDCFIMLGGSDRKIDDEFLEKFKETNALLREKGIFVSAKTSVRYTDGSEVDYFGPHWEIKRKYIRREKMITDLRKSIIIEEKSFERCQFDFTPL